MIITGIENINEPDHIDQENINWHEALEQARSYLGYGKFLEKCYGKCKPIYDSGSFKRARVQGIGSVSHNYNGH